jgi:hypothetical protein
MYGISKVLIGITIGIAALAAAGCNGTGSHAVRGKFMSDSCKPAERTALDSKAVYAIYVDAMGNPIQSMSAEDLTGTSANQMCPTPAHDDGPGPCPAGYCARLIGGKNYCLRC